MTYQTFGFGHDFGNSETCQVLFSPHGRFERRIPSVTSIGSWKRVVATAKGAGQEISSILSPDHYVLEYDDPQSKRRVEKFVGQKVFDDGENPLDSHGDSNRYWTNNYNLEMLMAGSASMVQALEYGLHVVTGLPISLYLDDPDNAEKVKKGLIGTHTFQFNGVEHTMHVLSVKVIMEGAGALIAYGENNDILQGVIDIGGRTTDLYVARGQKPRPANSKGFPMGVQAAAERFNVKFREAFGYTLSFDTRMTLLKQHVTHQPYRAIKEKQSRTIPEDKIEAIIEISLREIGQEIATSVVASWDEILMEFEKILIVGGGAYYFAKDIQERIKLASRTLKPEIANAQGYARLADAVAQRARLPQRSS